jgi:hypothetical protein
MTEGNDLSVERGSSLEAFEAFVEAFDRKHTSG